MMVRLTIVVSRGSGFIKYLNVEVLDGVDLVLYQFVSNLSCFWNLEPVQKGWNSVRVGRTVERGQTNVSLLVDETYRNCVYRNTIIILSGIIRDDHRLIWSWTHMNKQFLSSVPLEFFLLYINLNNNQRAWSDCKFNKIIIIGKIGKNNR